jgi:hypothetical protein
MLIFGVPFIFEDEQGCVYGSGTGCTVGTYRTMVVHVGEMSLPNRDMGEVSSRVISAGTGCRTALACSQMRMSLCTEVGTGMFSDEGEFVFVSSMVGGVSPGGEFSTGWSAANSDSWSAGCERWLGTLA